MKTITDTPPRCLPLKRFEALAARVGLSVLGVSSLEPLSDELDRVREWQESGFAGELRYMLRKPELLTSPMQVFGSWLASQEPSLRWSIVSVYCRYDARPIGPRPPTTGRVARYAWGRDYHSRLRRALERFAEIVQAEVGERFPYRVATDAIPLLERSLGARAGLGFIGKNTLLIRPGVGSLGFLAEILVPFDIVAPSLPVVGSCGSCTRCQAACPTGAFPKPYVLDARRCISYLTIEKEGLLTPAERSSIGEWVFGCDICQEVCPFNHRVLKEGRAPDIPEFSRDEGCGPFLPLAKVLSIRSDDEFRNQFAGTPLMRAGRAMLARNCICVAVNTNARELLPALEARLAVEPEAATRATLLWGVVNLTESARRRRSVLDAQRQDPAAEVQAEFQRLREQST